jgi:hypothetical protein
MEYSPSGLLAFVGPCRWAQTVTRKLSLMLLNGPFSRPPFLDDSARKGDDKTLADYGGF